MLLLAALAFVSPARLSQRTVPRVTALAMNGRSNWAAMDDGTPLGVLERDAEIVFGMLDEDSDGSITQAEMLARLLSCGYTEERVEKVFGKIDVNGDGVISKDEW